MKHVVIEQICDPVNWELRGDEYPYFESAINFWNFNTGRSDEQVVRLPLLGVKPKKTFYVCDRADNFIYNGYDKAAAEAVAREKNTVVFNGPMVLPQDQFLVLVRAGDVSIVAGEDRTNRCLLFVAGLARTPKVHADTTARVLVYNARWRDGSSGGMGEAFLAVLLEAGQRLVFTDSNSDGSKFADIYTWDGADIIHVCPPLEVYERKKELKELTVRQARALAI